MSQFPVASSGLRVLAVHGFVLAGGRSSRMGRDKALLPFRGRPMVEIAVEKLQDFCATVSIVGERPDLQRFAPVVRGERADGGPGGGIEAGLRACGQPWAMFLPVDVPLVPAKFLRSFASAVLNGPAGVAAAFLLADGKREPGFAMVRRDCQAQIVKALDQGVRRLDELWLRVDTNSGEDWVWTPGVQEIAGDATGSWFANVNTPDDLVHAENLAES